MWASYQTPDEQVLQLGDEIELFCKLKPKSSVVRQGTKRSLRKSDKLLHATFLKACQWGKLVIIFESIRQK